MDRTLIYWNSLGLSGPGSITNKEVQYIPKSSRFGALPSDAVYC